MDNLGNCQLCQSEPAWCVINEYENGQQTLQMKVCEGCEKILDEEKELNLTLNPS